MTGKRSLVTTIMVGMLGMVPAAARADVPCAGYETILFCGELNGDCKVTSTDALIALRMGVGLLSSRIEADMDHGGTVSSADALRLLRISVGAIVDPNSCAYQYTVNVAASGFYSQNGGHQANNYATGWFASGGEEIRSYFVFDVSSVPQPVATAMLRVSGGQPSFSSPNPSETFRLFAVAAPAATVSGGAGGTSVFADLGEGTVHGELAGVPGIGPLVDIPLNAAGLAYLDNAASTVVFGGAITTLAKGASSEFLFNATGLVSTRQLIVTVNQ